MLPTLTNVVAPSLGSNLVNNLNVNNNLDPIEQAMLDQFPQFPDQKDPNIQTIISGLAEFTELIKAVNFRPQAGQPYPHQQVVARLIEFCQVLLLYWEPGSGKTGGMAEIAEYLRKRYSVDYVDALLPTSIKQTIVIVPNQLIKQEFKRLLFCNHSAGFYDNSKIHTAVSEKQQKVEITKSLQQWYMFTTYASFVGRGKKSLQTLGVIDSEGNIINNDLFLHHCDNRLYLLDEIHTLQQDESISKYGTSKDIVFKVLKEIKRRCKNSKMVIASGTPAVKEVEEFKSILSLLHDYDLPDDLDLKQLTKAVLRDELTFDDLFNTLEPYLRGVISYMVSPSSGEKTKYIGQPVRTNYGSNLVIYQTTMSLLQTYYLAEQVRSRSLAGVGKEHEPVAGSVARRRETEASDFVYPPIDEKGQIAPAVIGEPAYSYYIVDETTDEAGNIKVKNVWHSPKLITIFRADIDNYGQPFELDPLDPQQRKSIIKNISNYSAKFYAILNSIEDPNQFYLTPGCVFMFFTSVENGVAPFAMALEALGYQRYNSRSSAFESTQQTAVANACGAGNNIGSRRLKSEVKKAEPGRWRYGIITGKTDNLINESLRELFNSPENVAGEYVRLLIVSQMAKAGINVFHCQMIHTEQGTWAPGITIQAERRALRMDGFDSLKNRLIQNKLNQLNQGNGQAEVARVTKEVEQDFIVKIYRHVARPLTQAELQNEIAELDNLSTLGQIDQNEYVEQRHMATEALQIAKSYSDKDRPVNADTGQFLQELPNVDLYIYKRAEKRQLRLNLLELCSARAAIDAWINKPVIEYKTAIANGPDGTGVDGGRRDAFSTIPPPFDPYQPKATTIDYKNFYLLYAQDQIEQSQKQILQMLQQGSVDVNSLITNSNQPKPIITQAIDKLINISQPFEPVPDPVNVDNPQQPLLSPVNQGLQLNSYYFPVAINYDNGLLYQNPKFGINDSKLVFYNDTIIANQIRTMSEVELQVSGIDTQTVFEDIIHLPAGEAVRNRLEAMRVGRAAVIELIITYYFSDRSRQMTPAARQILEAYGHMIFYLPRPDALLKTMNERVGKKNTLGTTDEIIDNYDNYFNKVNAVTDNLLYHYDQFKKGVTPTVPMVIIHTLNFIFIRSDKFNEKEDFLDPFTDKGPKYVVRMLDENWKDIRPPESKVYGPILRDRINLRVSRYQIIISTSQGQISLTGMVFPDIIPRLKLVITSTIPGFPNHPKGQEIATFKLAEALRLLQDLPGGSARIHAEKQKGGSKLTLYEVNKFIYDYLLQRNAIFWIVDFGQLLRPTIKLTAGS